MKKISILSIILLFVFFINVNSASSQNFDSSDVIKQGLIGAGTGAIAAGASGGKAGKGALIGAGAGVVGGVLLDALTGSNKKAPRNEEYVDESGEYYEYEEEPQSSSSGASKVIGQGLVGAGTGAIAAGASGGKAGEGALIGAGTNIVGNALLDTITGSDRKPAKKRYIKRRPQAEEQTAEQKTPSKKIIRKYDEKGNLVSEEEIYP